MGSDRLDLVPLDGRPLRLTVGLRPVPEAEWLLVDADADAELALKDRLLAQRHDEVFAALPDDDVAAGSAEVLAAVRTWLTEYDPALRERREPSLTPQLHPLDAAGRLVQEDLCLMVARGSGHSRGHVRSYVLGAASLCFPSRWRLADKLGQDMQGIHESVAGYADRLAVASDKAMDRIGPEPQQRANWTLLDSPDLFQPDPAGRRASAEQLAAAPELVGEHVHFRVERQTLRRMPSGSVLFTIRTTVRTLADLVTAHPESAADLALALRTAPGATVSYKGWETLRDPVLRWLEPLTR
ncbi:MAG: heme-dependent oxidative N-demethylase family protein [Motilibacteraceae bacterium]